MTDTETILRNLSLSLYGKTAAATFACGGTLTTKISPVAETSSSQPASLFLFYEDKGGEAHRLDFPASAQGMEHLASVCEQATFGRNTEDVLDTEYRSAWKLDNTKFSCSLHPADYDVVEVIRQLLFPGAVHSDIETAIGVELYKLNIYKGPHDKFKAHVDTPRGTNQFGSLVICLPSCHTGGELLVRHNGREVKFDWSGEHDTAQWAAFYSDCEHEVLPVTTGYRVTLTYNLYFNASKFQLDSSRNWGPSSLPLFQEFSSALQNRDFMSSGGVLGVYCYHDYAHASSGANSRIPGRMKGIDAAIWNVCETLGLEIISLPVYEADDRYGGYESSDDSDDGRGSDTAQTRWDPFALFGFTGASRAHLSRNGPEYIGYGFQPMHDDDLGNYAEEKPISRRMREGDFNRCRGIHWLNRPRYREPNASYIAYGNEATSGFLYSAAAMFILVPGWSEDRGLEDN